MTRPTQRRMAQANPRPHEGSGRAASLRHVVAAWLGAVVLAVNLFGWTITGLPEASPLPTLSTVASLFPDATICQNDNDNPADHSGSHDKMVCPACFPLGNASAGALVSVALAALPPSQPFLSRHALPDNASVRSAFHPHRYQARAPPQIGSSAIG